jgi:two-component system, NtrC family, sensor kinase
MIDINTRVLVIDDEEIVRDSFREILNPPRNASEALGAAEAALFGSALPPKRNSLTRHEFAVDFARNGHEGVRLVQASVTNDRPYAVIFTDMRMPGLDGLATAEQIREIDPRAEIIFVTGYSDHSIETVVSRVGEDVGYQCKPFAPEEISQLATKGVADWNKIRGLERVIGMMSSLSLHRDATEALLQNVLEQVLRWTGTTSAILAKVNGAQGLQDVWSAGELTSASAAASLLKEFVPPSTGDTEGEVGGYAWFRLSDQMYIFVPAHEGALRGERRYLLKLFLQHAAIGLENSKMQERLAKAERLANLGLLVGQLAHDLRQPIQVCMMACDAMQMDRADPQAFEESAEMVRRAIDDLTSYTSEILDFASGAPAKLAQGTVGDLLDELQPRVRFLRSHSSISIDVEGDANIPLQLDRVKLGRALINLVNNAVEAAGSRADGSGRVRVAFSVQAGAVVCDVSDNGPGIPVALHATLFEALATHGKAQGTGFGLSIAKRVVESHGGTITLVPETVGTTFRIQLPIGT